VNNNEEKEKKKIRKKEERRKRRTHKGQRASMLKRLNNFISQL